MIREEEKALVERLARAMCSNCSQFLPDDVVFKIPPYVQHVSGEFFAGGKTMAAWEIFSRQAYTALRFFEFGSANELLQRERAVRGAMATEPDRGETDTGGTRR
jgi:hypothetical protein